MNEQIKTQNTHHIKFGIFDEDDRCRELFSTERMPEELAEQLIEEIKDTQRNFILSNKEEYKNKE